MGTRRGKSSGRGTRERRWAIGCGEIDFRAHESYGLRVGASATWDWTFCRVAEVWIRSGSVQGLYRGSGKGRDAKEPWKRFSPHRASTVGTDGDIDARELEQELLPAHHMHIGGRRRV